MVSMERWRESQWLVLEGSARKWCCELCEGFIFPSSYLFFFFFISIWFTVTSFYFRCSDPYIFKGTNLHFCLSLHVALCNFAFSKLCTTFTPFSPSLYSISFVLTPVYPPSALLFLFLHILKRITLLLQFSLHAHFILNFRSLISSQSAFLLL